MPDIPNEYHFVFGLREQHEPMHVAHYLCLESCRQVNRPDRIHFHYRHEPYGGWWERIRPHLSLHRAGKTSRAPSIRARDESAEARQIRESGWLYAHEADFIRLEVLLESGGVYADMDTLFVQALPQRLFRCDFVLGEEPPLPGSLGILRPSLGNAVIMSRARAPFAARWLEQMHRVYDGSWDRHSTQEAARLWGEMPEALHVVPQRFFYRHAFTREGIHALLTSFDPDYSAVYSMHLWAHLWWDERRTDFTEFHAGMLTEAYIRDEDTTYNVIARQFLP
jgi:Glycosyltransferase sugar-binding region containing DXD motif